MKLINLDPIGPFNKEWENTYGNREDSTIRLRHFFTHKGIEYSKKEITIIPISKIAIPKKPITELFGEIYLEEIKKRIKDAIVLVSYLENQVIKKYSFRELYPSK